MACRKLGIDINECIRRPKADFFMPDVPEEIATVRFKNHIERVIGTHMQVSQERKQIIKEAEAKAQVRPFTSGFNDYDHMMMKESKELRSTSKLFSNRTSGTPQNKDLWGKLSDEYDKMSGNILKQQKDVRKFLEIEKKKEKMLEKMEKKNVSLKDFENRKQEDLKMKIKDNERKREEKRQALISMEKEQEDAILSEDIRLTKEYEIIGKKGKKIEEMRKQKLRDQMDEYERRLERHKNLREEIDKRDTDLMYQKLEQLKEKYVMSQERYEQKLKEKSLLAYTNHMNVGEKFMKVKQEESQQTKRKEVMYIGRVEEIEKAQKKKDDIIKRKLEEKKRKDEEMNEKVQSNLKLGQIEHTRKIQDLERKVMTSEGRRMRRSESIEEGLKKEKDKLREENIQQNLERQRRKLELKKLYVLEKNKIMSERLRLSKTEEDLIQRAKRENFMKTQQEKMRISKTIFHLSHINLKSGDTKKYVKEAAPDIDIEDLFKVEVKAKKPEEE